MAKLQSIVGKAISDATFCQKLVADPEGTLKASGVDATSEMIGAIRAVDAGGFQKLAAAFARDQAAM